MVVVQFPSHSALTETNRPCNTNDPLLSHHLQSEQAIFFPPFSLSLFSHSISLPSSCSLSLFTSFHLWLRCQPASDTPGCSFHFGVRDGMRERSKRGEKRKEERKDVMICPDECSWRESDDAMDEGPWEEMCLMHQSQSSSDHLSVFNGLSTFIK